MATISPAEYEARIKALEKQCKTLAAEIDRMRPVVDTAVRHGYGQLHTELGQAVRAYEVAKTDSESQHVADTQGPPTLMDHVDGIPVMKLNDGKRR